MASYNHCALLGNLTRDPEVRYTPKGTAVTGVCLAVNRKWKDEAGETREEVSFIDCTCFGRTAEVVSEYCRKGDPLLVDGRLKQETWEDKNGGGKRSRLVVVVDQVQLLGGRGGGQGAGERRANAASAGAKSAPAQGDSGGGGEAPAEDDVPF